jgi:predicted RNase H-like HicB family nuclease
MEWTAVFMKGPEGDLAFVEDLPGANTQAPTIEEAREDLREAVALVLEANWEATQRSLGDRKVTREPFVLPG